MLATAESKNQAVSKLESLIERGRSRAANVIDHVMCNQPTDRLVRGDALQFRAADNLPEILITVPDREQAKVDQTLHRNAIYQMAHTTDMPVKFLDSMGPGRWPWQSRKELVSAQAELHPETERRATVVGRCSSGVLLERRSTAWPQVPCAEQWLTVGQAN